MQPGAELAIARLGFEFLRPVPLAPLTLTTRILRKGRRVQELAAELTADLGGTGTRISSAARAHCDCSLSPTDCPEAARRRPRRCPAESKAGPWSTP